MLDRKDTATTLEAVVREHARFVFKVAYGVLRHAHDAEDVVQDVFLRAQRSKLAEVRDMRAWLARVAFRLAIDRVRRPEPVDLDELALPAVAPDAEASAIRRQQVERARRMIDALPEELRYPLVLSALEELSSREISEILGIPESSVRNRIFRARQLLKEKLAAVAERR